MATNYPASLDSFVNPVGTDRLDLLDHAAEHSNANDSISAIQIYLGIAGSSDSASITYKLNGKAEAIHSHLIGDVTGLQTALDGKASSSHTHTLSQITDAGTAASKDVPPSGNASSLQIVLGSDTRLSDARTPTAHSHAISDVTGLQAALDAKGSGSVTSFGFTAANGFSGSVTNASTTPNLTIGTSITGILKGNGTAISAATAGTDYEVPLTFSTGLTRNSNTVTVNAVQNITKLSNLTTNGLLKTSGGDGTLSVDTTAYLTSAITTINSQTGSAITIAVGTSGSDFSVNSVSDTITLNLPDASATNRGVITAGTQTIAGAKNFSGGVTVEGQNVTYGGNSLFSSNISGNAIYYNQAQAVFTTAASGSVSGADTGGYVDITTAYNTTTNVNVTNGGTLYNRFYIGYAQGVPRILTFYMSTAGVGGTITWERWNGLSWSTISVSNLTADGSTAITTSATSKTTINGVSAFWIRGTVATAYTTAPRVKFGIGSGFSNMIGPESGAGLYLGKANLSSTIQTAIKNNLKQASIAVVNGGNGEQDILAAYSEYTGALIGTLDGGFSMTANNADNTFRALTLNGGGSNFAYCLKLGNASRSMSAWGGNGCYLQSASGTMTDSSTAVSGTATLSTFNSFAQPTLAATNTSVTTTEAATVYIAGAPIAGTNQTITNSYALSVNGKTKVDSLTVNKASTSGVVALTDGATINLDASLGNHFRVTLGGSRTLAIPTNPVDGQKITIEVIQDGTGSRTLTLTTGSSGAFAFGSDITSLTLSATANARDLIGCIYSSSKARWLVVSVIKGF